MLDRLEASSPPENMNIPAETPSIDAFQEITSLNDLVEVTLIDQILRGAIAHNEHRLNGLTFGNRLQKLHLAFHACDGLDADRVGGVFHFAYGEHIVGAIEYQVDLHAGSAPACRREVRPHGEINRGKAHDAADIQRVLQAQILEGPPDPGVPGAAAGDSREDVRALPGADLFEIGMDEGKIEPQ